MIVLKDFYTIASCEEKTENAYLAKIILNPEHPIFRGHFPGNPVTPGVCMMQIVKELSEHITQQNLTLSSASNIKFMAIIDPEETPELMLDLAISETEDGLKVKNISYFGETIALKMSINYKKTTS